VSLRAQSLAGIRVIGAAQLLRSLIGSLTLIIMARLLTPGMFGQVGIVMALLGLLMLLVEFGFRQAIIQRPEIDLSLADSIWWLNLGVGLLFMFTVAVASGWIARLFHQPDLAILVLALVPLLPLSAMRAVPLALLERRLAFRTLAGLEVLATTAGAVAGIGLALAGAGIWSLVAQMLVASLTLTLLLVPSGWRPRRHFAWHHVRQMLRFGGETATAESIDYGGRYTDDFLIGRFLGAQSLGYYHLAYQVMLFPLLTVSRLIGRVLLPAASRIQNDNAGLGNAFTEVASAVAIITFPLMLGIVAVAEPLVVLALGESWRPIIPLLLILAPVGALQSIMVLSDSLFIAKGRTDLRLRWSLFQTGASVAGVVLGLPFGLIGVAAGYALANACLAPPLLRVVCGQLELTSARLIRVLARPLLASLAMLCCVHLLFLLIPEGYGSTGMRAALGTMLGAVSYLGLILYLEGPRLRRLARDIIRAVDPLQTRA
jgi:O-antigen/teichoic acid export membrane protein